MTDIPLKGQYEPGLEYPDDCLLCDEFNMVVVCPDDMCRAAGDCVLYRGPGICDGMAVCRCQTDPEAGPLVG